MNVFQSPFISSRTGPNISNTDPLYSFCNVRDHVSDSYKTKGRTVIPCSFNFYKSSEKDAKRKDSDMNGSKQSSNLIFSHFVFQCKVDVLVVFQTPNFSTFFKDFLAAFMFRDCAVF
jgi:hypothetical protein